MAVEWKKYQYNDPRVTSIASSATPTPNVDTTDLYLVTALAEAATFGVPAGTPSDGQKFLIRIKDNGTARSLSWNAIYVGDSLPDTTVASITLYLLCIYNSAASKWDATLKEDFAKTGVNADITSMTGLDNDGIPLAKVANAASDGINADITSMTGLDDGGIPLSKVADADKHTSSSESVADEDSIIFDTGKTGRGWAMAGDNEEYIKFRFTAAGAVTVINNSANAINTDKDGFLCVYDTGTGIAIKNRLGATKIIRYVVYYS